MCVITEKLEPHINKITKDIVDVVYQLGCVIVYGLGIDKFFEVLDDG